LCTFKKYEETSLAFRKVVLKQETVSKEIDFLTKSIPLLLKRQGYRVKYYERIDRNKEFDKIGEEVRSVKLDLMFPGPNTVDDTCKYFSRFLEALLKGHYRSFPRRRIKKLTPKGHIRSLVQVSLATLKAVFRALAPLVIFLAVENYWPELLTFEYEGYILAGLILYAVVVLIIELDPDIGKKLDVVKQTMDLFKKDKGKD
jgi:hypothetical protein